MNQNNYMELVIEHAKKAALLNEVPIGAALVDEKNQKLLSIRHNEIVMQNNPLNHAEMLVIEEVCKFKKSRYLGDTVIYVTLEPCAMCLGAMMHARIERIVYGAHDPKTGVCGSSENLIDANCFNHKIDLASGVLENECKQLLKKFFISRR